MRCGGQLRVERSHRRNRKYCRRCAKEAKRERNRRHKRRYRETGLGREQRKRENRRARERLGWAEYMRFWRKANPRRTAKRNRAKCERYYEQHREKILRQRREQRAVRRNRRSASSP